MIHISDPTIVFIDIIKHITPKRASVGDDIKKPGVTEWGYDALPLKGVAQLNRFLKATRSILPLVNAPTLLFHSVEDHVLPISNSDIILNEVGSSWKSRVELGNSYHVATLDYDAPEIFEQSLAFVRDRI